MNGNSERTGALPTLGSRAGATGMTKFGFTRSHALVATMSIAGIFVALGPGGYTGWVTSAVLFAVVLVAYRYDSLARRHSHLGWFAASTVVAATIFGLLVSSFGPPPARELAAQTPGVPDTWTPQHAALNHSGYFAPQITGPLARVALYKTPGSAKAAAAAYAATLRGQDWAPVAQSDYQGLCVRETRFGFRRCPTYTPVGAEKTPWVHLRHGRVIVTVDPVGKRLLRVTTLPAPTVLDATLHAFTRPPQ